ncbi:NAD-dependent DNA ligase LigA, partial [Pseudomonas amygdali pv. mori str. 301020]
DKTIEQLVDEKLIGSPADLYKLKYEQTTDQLNAEVATVLNIS